MKESSLAKDIDISFANTKDYRKTYIELHSIMEEQLKKEKYSSLDSNFDAIFIYEMIRRKTPIKDFDDTIKSMGLSEKKVEWIFCRYLNHSDISLSHYVKHDRYHNNFSMWDNMTSILFNIKDDKKVLEETTLPYLKSMLNALAPDNVLGLYAGNLSTFLYNLPLKSLEPLLPIFNKPVFEICKEGYNHPFKKLLLNLTAQKSYENSKEENIENFKNLDFNITNFQEVYKDSLISYKDSSGTITNKLKIDLSTLNFLISVGVDTCSIIQDKYRQAYDTHQSSRFFDKVSSDISSSLSVSLKGDIDFNLNIDTSVPIAANYVVLKYLENKINNGAIHIPEEIRQYIVAQKEIEDKKERYERIEVDLDKILTYISYQSLDEALEVKTSSAIKRKI